MMSGKNISVIAISGASGCGKTSLVKTLAQTLNCPALHFDDFVDENTYPQDMALWLEQGCNTSLIKTPRLTQAVKEFRCSAHSADFLFLEEPFGRERAVMTPLVDKVILLDTPLPVCLERVIARVNKSATGLRSPQNQTQLTQYLEKYHRYLADIYQQCVAQVDNNSDLQLKGDLSLTESRDYIIQWLSQ